MFITGCPEECDPPSLDDELIVCTLDSCAYLEIDSSYNYMWSPDVMTISPDRVELCASENTMYYVTITKEDCSETFKDSVYVRVEDQPVPEDCNIREVLEMECNYGYANGVLTYALSYNQEDFNVMCGFDPDRSIWVLSVGGSMVTDTGVSVTGEISGLSPCDLQANVSLRLMEDEESCPFDTSKSSMIEVDPMIELTPACICLGGSALLVRNPEECYTYEWSPSEGLSFDAPYSEANPLASPDVTTTYIVTVSNGSRSFTDSVTVEVFEPDVLTLESDTIICGPVINLSALTGRNDTRVEWSTTRNFSNVFSTDKMTTYEVGNDQDEAITLYARGISSACDPVPAACIVIDSVTIVPYRKIRQISRMPDSLMRGDTLIVTLEKDPRDEISTIWTVDGNVTILDSSSCQFIAIANEDGPSDICLTYVSTSMVCEGSTCEGTFCIPIPPPPPPKNPPNPMGVKIACTFEGQLSIDSCYTDSDVAWIFNGSTIPMANPRIDFGSAGTYEVTLTSLNNPSDFTDTTISVVIPEIIQIMPADSTISYCSADSIDLEINTNIDPVDVLWVNDAGDTLGFGSALRVDPTSSGVVRVSASDECNCADEAIFRFEPFDLNVNIDAPQSVCIDDPFVVSAMESTGASDVMYEWSTTDPGVTIVNPNSASTSIEGDLMNPLSLSLSVMRGDACALDTTFSVTIVTVDITTDVGADNCILVGESVTLTAETNLTNPIFTWTPTGDTTPNTTDSPQDETVYTVIVSDGGGAECEASINVPVFECIWDVPSAFSPNGNNMNDFFRVRVAKDRNLQPFTMKILNRWGQEVYVSTDPTQGWDGRFENKELPPDVYAYCIQATCPDGSQQVKSGNVTLLR